MEPTLWTGSILIVRATDPGELSVGDVVTFQTPQSEGENAPGVGTYTTHRITDAYRMNGEYVFNTKGDANDVADSWQISGDAIVGRAVTAIPLLGYASLYAKTPLGFVALILIPGLAVIGFELRSLLSSRREVEAIVVAKREAQ
jgi:signal peptidase